MQSLIYDTNRFFNNPNPFSVPILDAQVTAGGNGVNSLTLTLSTKNGGEWLIVATEISNPSATVSGISVTGGNMGKNAPVFTKLTSTSTANDLLEIWIAYAPVALNSASITVNYAGGLFPQATASVSAYQGVDHINKDNIALASSASGNSFSNTIIPTNNSLIFTAFGMSATSAVTIDNKLNVTEVLSGGASSQLDIITPKTTTSPYSTFMLNGTLGALQQWVMASIELVPSTFYQNALLHSIGKIDTEPTRGTSTKGFFSQTSKITIDKISRGSNTATNFTFDHSVPNPNSVLIIIYGNSTSNVTGNPSFNGTPFTRATLANLYIGYILNPSVGTYPLSVTFAGNTNFTYCAITVSGLDTKQKTPLFFSTNISSVPLASLSVFPESANSFVLDAITYSGNPGNFTQPLAEQTQITNLSLGERLGVSFSLISSTKTLSWGYSTNNAGSGQYAALVFKPAQPASIWSPNISTRNIQDVIKVNAQDLIIGGGGYASFGYFPANFFQNSFLHTIGRMIKPANSIIASAVQETERQSSQILIDRVVQGQTSGGTTLNLQVNIPSKDAVLVVTGGSVIATGGAWQSVTFNGTPLTKIVQAGIAGQSAEIWWYPYPPVGTGTLSIVPTATFGEVNANAMVLLGVDKKSLNVINTSVTDAAATATITANITPDAPNSLIIDALAALDTTAPPIPDTSQNQMFNATQLVANEYVFSTYKLSTSGAEQMSYNLSAAVNASLVAISLRPMQAPSLWFPNIDARSLNDVTDASGLDAGTNPAFGSYGNKPSMFWKNSFLHTVGRMLYEPQFYPIQNTASGLVGYYNFNEGTGTYIKDLTNTAGVGRWGGTLGDQWRTNGKINGSGNFNGVDNFIEIPNSPAIVFKQGMTISLWVKRNGADSAANFEGLVSKWSGPNAYSFLYNHTTKVFSLLLSGVNAGATFNSNTNAGLIEDGQWHYVIVTYDSVQVVFYLDGNAIGATGARGTITTNTATLRIGDDVVQTNSFWRGQIGEVGLWNRGLSSFEIKTLYNNGQGLQFPFTANNQFAIGIQGYNYYAQEKPYWQTSFLQTIGRVRQFQGIYPNLRLKDAIYSYYKMDETQGTAITDIVNNNRRAAINNGKFNGTLGNQWKPGIINSALNFNGSDNNVTFANSVFYQQLGTNSFSVSAWINTTSANKQAIAGDYNGNHVILHMISGKAAFQIRAAAAGGSFLVTGITNINDGRNHFVVGVRDSRSNLVLIYVDGKLEASATGDSANFNITGSTSMIGDITAGVFAIVKFTGLIGEVGLWNTGLIASEVAYLYNLGQGISYPFLNPTAYNTFGVYDYNDTSLYRFWKNSFLQTVGRVRDPNPSTIVAIFKSWRMMMGIGI